MLKNPNKLIINLSSKENVMIIKIKNNFFQFQKVPNWNSCFYYNLYSIKSGVR